MHFASDRWLHFYRYITSAIQVLIIALYVSVMTNDTFAGIWFFNAITPVSVVLATLHVLFALFVYQIVEKKSAVFATTILGGLFTINILSLMHVSGGLHSPWVVGWAIVCLLGGILGPAISSGPAFLITLYYVLIQVSAFDAVNEGRSFIDFQGLVVVLGSFALSVISWHFWKKMYVNTSTVEVQKLTGQLKSRQQLSDVLVQSIADGIIVVDTTGKISVLNPAAGRMSGWGTDEAVGIDIRLVAKLHEEDGTEIPDKQNIFSKVLATQKPVEAVQQLVKRDNSTIIASLVVSPIILPQTSELAGAVAVVRDISESRAEEARRADFISTASHEMRTPVAAIEGYLALALNEKVSQIDSNARNYLQKAHSSTQHLGKLFQDLLTSAKAEDGRLVSHPQSTEIGEYVQQLTDDLRFTAEKKGLLVDLIIGSADKASRPETVAGGKTIKPLYYTMADPDRLREVITNLFDNAVKYTESGKITIGLTGNNDVIQIFIRDTGPGIPAEDVPHLFQKFYRVDNSATRTIGGTGLGLFICRKIIELYKGRIWVESEWGKGSTFYINLPRISAQQAAAEQSKTASNQANT